MLLEYSKAHKLSYDHDVIAWRGSGVVLEIAEQKALHHRTSSAWIADHKNGNPPQANRYRALLSLTYRLGMQNGKVTQNPARLMRHRQENNARLRWLTQTRRKSTAKSYRGTRPPHLPELEIAINTGSATSEQYRLTWELRGL